MVDLDVVIRIHDPARLDEFAHAVFSATLSDHRPLRLVIIAQRFTPQELNAVQAALAPFRQLAQDVPIALLNHTRSPAPRDARAALLNQGIRAATGRYLAFLDYDDLIYPEAYRRLVAELQASQAAIAFAGILNTSVTRDGLVPYTTAKRRIFKGNGLPDLLRDNFCPLHSFVIDRNRVAADDLVIDETLTALEDYDLLLRLVARYPTSFRLKDTILGEYLLKDDGSNLNPLAQGSNPAWQEAEAKLNTRKAHLILGPVPQATLSLDHPGLTIAAYLATVR